MTESSVLIIVAGMHRSGTSALARVINLLGADIATDLVPAGIGNELGHWEAKDAQTLHNAMLADAGSSVTSAVNFREEWFDGSSARVFTEKVAEHISANYSASRLAVVKDPRVALFIPIWLAAARSLSIEPRFIIPFRHPEEVAASLEARQPKLDRYGAVPVPQGTAMWLRHVIAAEKYTRDQVRSFVSFESLIANWRKETDRIASQLQITWPRRDHAGPEIDGFIDSRQLSATRDGGVASTPMAEALYSELLAFVDDPARQSDVFDQSAAAIALAESILGAHVLSQEQRVRELRETLDQHSRRHAEEAANAHRRFAQEINERDRRLQEAITYAKSLEQSR